MKMFNAISYYVLPGIMLCTLLVPAQAQTNKDLNKEVQVTRAYDPIISDANKITLPILSNDTLLSIRGGYQYTVKPPVLQTSSFSLRPIPAARISGADYKDPQWLYARLGIGYPLRPLVDLYVSNINPNDLSMGLQYNHRSIWASISNPMGSKIPIDEMSQGATAYINKQFESLNLSAQVGFKQHRVLFYGYDTGILNKDRLPSFTFNKDSLTQSYTSFFANVGVGSFSTDPEAFRYGAHALVDFFGDNGKGRFNKGRMFAMRENSFGGNLFLGKLFGEGNLIQLNADLRIFKRSLNYNTDYNATPTIDRQQLGTLFQSLYGAGKGRDTSNTRMHLTLHPSYRLDMEKLHLDLGLQYAGYRQHDAFKSRLFPKINVLYDVATEFIPYARFDGSIDMNDYQSIASENPYISPGMNMNMNASERTYGVQVGFKGTINELFTYNVFGNYDMYKDLYFFVNSPQPVRLNTTYSLQNNFDVLYDDVQRLKVGAELQATISTVKTSLAVAYFNYMLDELQTPYHRPSLVADWTSDVTMNKNWIFNLSVHAQGQSPYLYSTGLKKALYNKAFFDINLGAEYLVSRSLSVFLMLNNIANQQYEVWHQYKTPGIGVLGGITYKL